MDTVFLDYGHGGIINGRYQTAGKQYHFTDANGRVIRSIYEGVVNRQIAALYANYLLAHGYRVYDVVAGRYLTGHVEASQLEQRDTSLEVRVARANDIRHGIYMSIHANAIGDSARGPSLSARGFIAFTSEGQTKSDEIAETICTQVEALTAMRVRRDRATDGDSDYERQFFVLYRTHMPAVLVECGFFTNWDDAEYISSAEGQARLALALFKGTQPHLRTPSVS